MIIRITGSGFVKQGSVTDGHPIEFRHWKDVVDECDFALESAIHSEEEEAVVDLWLEDPKSFQDEETSVNAPTMRRVQAGLGLQRHDPMQHKTATTRNWDQDYSEAQQHVASIMKNLGNGR